MKRWVGAALALVLAGCAAGAPRGTQSPAGTVPTSAPASQAVTTPAATTTPASTASSAPQTPASALKMPTGQDLCYLLTAADFTAAGVPGAGTLSTNEYDTDYFCVWAGKSVATGGIEMDAFIDDDPVDRDETFDSVSTGESAEDVTAQVAGAQRANIGTTSSDGPEFAEIAVQSGNFIFGIGIPPTGDWHTQLIALANLVVLRAVAVAGGATALPAASPTD
jgi:hypothetical protein